MVTEQCVHKTTALRKLLVVNKTDPLKTCFLISVCALYSCALTYLQKDHLLNISLDKKNRSKSKKLPQFSIDEYDNWSFLMTNHLGAIHQRMSDVLEEGPITFDWNPVDNGKIPTDTSTGETTREKNSKEEE